MLGEYTNHAKYAKACEYENKRNRSRKIDDTHGASSAGLKTLTGMGCACIRNRKNYKRFKKH